MSPLEELKNGVEVLEGFAETIAGTRRKLLNDWQSVEQTADLAWTLTEVLHQLEKVSECIETALDGERNDLELANETGDAAPGTVTP